MADRNFNYCQTLNESVRFIGGNFSIAASGGAATKVNGLGWSVAKTTTGVYTITLEDSYVSLIACNVSVMAATAVDLVAQIKSHDVVSAKTIVIDLNAGATPTEPSAVTLIHFIAMLSNTTVASV